MALVSSQFDKNDSSVEALTARNQVLNREIETQKQKIKTLRSALENAAAAFGENDRRKALGKAYSGKSVFSEKLVCEDCGGFFGSKVWHSTDRYRRTIWQCNSKFSNEKRCSTPTLDTETIQWLFIKAYNRLMQGQKQVIADCELMRKKLTDFAALDAEIDRQREETQVVAELVKAAIQENASTAQSQEAYRKRYEALTRRYETAAAKSARLPQSTGQSHGAFHPNPQKAAGRG